MGGPGVPKSLLVATVPTTLLTHSGLCVSDNYAPTVSCAESSGLFVTKRCQTYTDYHCRSLEKGVHRSEQKSAARNLFRDCSAVLRSRMRGGG